MRIHQASRPVKTTSRVGVTNVTDLVAEEVGSSGIGEGFVLVSVPHTTCGIVLNEDEPGLVADITRLAGSLLDPIAAEGPFAHDRIDDNARAHLTSILLGSSCHLAVSGAAPALGRWQSLMLVEMDGPRRRTLDIRVWGP